MVCPVVISAGLGCIQRLRIVHGAYYDSLGNCPEVKMKCTRGTKITKALAEASCDKL